MLGLFLAFLKSNVACGAREGVSIRVLPGADIGTESKVGLGEETGEAQL